MFLFFSPTLSVHSLPRPRCFRRSERVLPFSFVCLCFATNEFLYFFIDLLLFSLNYYNIFIILYWFSFFSFKFIIIINVCVCVSILPVFSRMFHYTKKKKKSGERLQLSHNPNERGGVSACVFVDVPSGLL